MEKVRNKIITLSGDPGSGKGSVAKGLSTAYSDAGYKVHIISVGDMFRKAVKSKYKEVHPEVKRISLGKILQDPSFAQTLKELDQNVDSIIVTELGKEINKKFRPNDIFIVDSRLAWHFIPDTFAVRLTIDPRIAGERIFNATDRGPEDQYETVEEAIETTEGRKQNEMQRYRRLYNADLEDNNNFNLVIDTSFTNVDDIVRTIKTCEDRDSKKKPYTKTWASPKLFYPTQSIRHTISKGYKRCRFPLKNFSESIRKNGIYPDQPISSITRGNSRYQFVSDGHHRVFGSIEAGNTLIPYKVIGHVDIETITSDELLNIYDHESYCEFQYGEYPKEGPSPFQELDRA